MTNTLSCSSCHKTNQVPDGVNSIYCAYCGTQNEVVASVTPTASSEPVLPRNENKPTQAQILEDTKKKFIGMVKGVALICGAIILVGLLAGLIVRATSSSNNNNNNNNAYASNETPSVSQESIYPQEQIAQAEYDEKLDKEVADAKQSGNSALFEEAIAKRKNDPKYIPSRVHDWVATVSNVGDGSYDLQNKAWEVDCVGYNDKSYTLYLDKNTPMEQIRKLVKGTKIRFSADNGNNWENYTNVTFSIIE